MAVMYPFPKETHPFDSSPVQGIINHQFRTALNYSFYAYAVIL